MDPKRFCVSHAWRTKPLTPVLALSKLTVVTSYAIFHPLAYLVKLNIEMSMAHLIKKIAMNSSRSSDLCIIPNSHNSAFRCCSQDTDSLPPTRQTISILKSVFGREQPSPELQILKTEEFRVQSRPVSDMEQQSVQGVELEIYDGASFASNNDSAAWADIDWRSTNGDVQSTSSVRNLHDFIVESPVAPLSWPTPALRRPN